MSLHGSCERKDVNRGLNQSNLWTDETHHERQEFQTFLENDSTRAKLDQKRNISPQLLDYIARNEFKTQTKTAGQRKPPFPGNWPQQPGGAQASFLLPARTMVFDAHFSVWNFFSTPTEN
jgi:hypothetical protein